MLYIIYNSSVLKIVIIVNIKGILVQSIYNIHSKVIQFLVLSTKKYNYFFSVKLLQCKYKMKIT